MYICAHTYVHVHTYINTRLCTNIRSSFPFTRKSSRASVAALVASLAKLENGSPGRRGNMSRDLILEPGSVRSREFRIDVYKRSKKRAVTPAQRYTRETNRDRIKQNKTKRYRRMDGSRSPRAMAFAYALWDAAHVENSVHSIHRMRLNAPLSIPQSVNNHMSDRKI